jgi:hypothetical protein
MKPSKKIFILFSFFLSSLFCLARQEGVLSEFTVVQQGGKVFLHWTIEAGSICTGTSIYRSSDAVHFSQIGQIEGICGNLDRAESYSHIDYNPLNSVNYYRIELGIYGFSEIKSVDFNYIASGTYKIRPNPVRDIAKIYFNSDKRELQQFSLFNNTGHRVMTLSTNENCLDVSAAGLQKGIYFFTISQGSLVNVKGRFIVVH